MKKQLLWASLLLSLTFSQQSEAAAVAVPYTGVLDVDVKAVRARLGPLTIREEVNALSTRVGYLATDATAALGLDARAGTILGNINTQLGILGATGTNTDLGTVAADIATINPAGLSMLEAQTGLGNATLVDTGAGNEVADYAAMVAEIEGNMISVPIAGSVQNSINAILALILDVPSTNIENDIAAVLALIGGTGTLQTQVAGLQAQIAAA